MINIENLSLSFSGNPILDNVSFMIGEKDKIGLVGKNGAGKSSLLKIFYGQLKSYTGNIVIPKDLRLGYLPQEKLTDSKKTVYEESKTAFDEVNIVEEEIAKIITEMQERTDYQSDSYLSLADKLDKLNDKRILLGAENNEAKLEQVLKGLGFKREDFFKPLKTFSGGWQMRVELAKVLLRNPDVILLDEPTNHLDIDSIEWLEQFLSSFSGAVVLVSHDRAFLDKITNRTIEIAFQRIEDYKASYSRYVELRKEKIQHQQAQFSNQQKEIAQLEEFINRFRYKNTKAKQVQSKIKYLNKMDKVEVEQMDNTVIRFLFPPAPRCGKIIIEAENLAKNYGDLGVFSDLSFGMQQNNRVAFVGQNGQGKTTLCKMIMDEVEYEGNIKLGHNVKIGYYPQNATNLLDPEKTVFQTLDDIAVGEVRKKIRGILGSFLFRDDDIDKKVKVLSGGEKSRLALAKLLLEPHNLLILDEPTNHLDMQSKDILKNALLHFDGSLILVSHDRDFLKGLSDKVFEFKEGKIKQFNGDIEEFLALRKIQYLNEYERQKKQKTENTSQNKGKEKWENKKEMEKQLRKCNKSILETEAEVEKMEEKIKEIDFLLAGTKTEETIDFAEIGKQRHSISKKIEEKMYEWELLHDEKEELEQALNQLIKNE
jgi:ATP-binding cassette subfamily F protein 3